MMKNAIILALISRWMYAVNVDLVDDWEIPAHTAVLRIYSDYGVFQATFLLISHSRKVKNGNWLHERAILMGKSMGDEHAYCN